MTSSPEWEALVHGKKYGYDEPQLLLLLLSLLLLLLLPLPPPLLLLLRAAGSVRSQCQRELGGV